MRTLRPIPRATGFTLVELLVAVTVLAVLLAVGAPSFLATIASNRLTSQINELVADVSYARNEAATRGSKVTICMSEDGTNCATSGTAWENGRLIFVDLDGDGARDAGDLLLKAVPALSGNSTLAAAGFSNPRYIRFRPYGGLDPAIAGGTFTLCSASTSTGRQVSIAITGRPQARQVDCP